jgi:hypothetical protein
MTFCFSKNTLTTKNTKKKISFFPMTMNLENTKKKIKVYIWNTQA